MPQVPESPDPYALVAKALAEAGLPRLVVFALHGQSKEVGKLLASFRRVEAALDEQRLDLQYDRRQNPLRIASLTSGDDAAWVLHTANAAGVDISAAVPALRDLVPLQDQLRARWEDLDNRAMALARRNYQDGLAKRDSRRGKKGWISNAASLQAQKEAWTWVKEELEGAHWNGYEHKTVTNLLEGLRAEGHTLASLNRAALNAQARAVALEERPVRLALRSLLEKSA